MRFLGGCSSSNSGAKYSPDQIDLGCFRAVSNIYEGPALSLCESRWNRYHNTWSNSDVAAITRFIYKIPEYFLSPHTIRNLAVINGIINSNIAYSMKKLFRFPP